MDKCDEFAHEVTAVVTFDKEGKASIRLKTNFGMQIGEKIPLKNCPGASIEIIGASGCDRPGPKNGHAII